MRDEDITYTIIVNSTDSYEDCWYPFFRLFSKFWPNCEQKIVLNTETKDFRYPGLNITCSKVYGNKPNQKLTWSECFLKCLKKIEAEVILYLQDDYFINGNVDVQQIDELFRLMLKKKYTTIRLMECANAGPWHPTDHPLLWKVDQKAFYRISLQASLWRKDRLRSYIRKHENPWQLEFWGSRRAHRVQDSILCINRNIFNEQNRQAIPYKPTGIIKGKWNKEAVYNLFLENWIDIDFSRRGFYDPKQESVRKVPLVTRIISRFRSAF